MMVNLAQFSIIMVTLPMVNVPMVSLAMVNVNLFMDGLIFKFI